VSSTPSLLSDLMNVFISVLNDFSRVFNVYNVCELFFNVFSHLCIWGQSKGCANKKHPVEGWWLNILTGIHTVDGTRVVVDPAASRVVDARYLDNRSVILIRKPCDTDSGQQGNSRRQTSTRLTMSTASGIYSRAKKFGCNLGRCAVALRSFAA